jgi:hypothetical protein
VFHFDSARDWAATAPSLLALEGTTVVVLEIEPVLDRPAPKSPGPAAARAEALKDALAG